jgi:glycosyltransferase involved in cell wall biosynthesis
VTPLAPSPIFQRLTGAAAESAQVEMQTRYQLRPGFFVAVGYEPRKNVARVIEAYQMLEPSLRGQHSLLIVCAREPVRQELMKRVDELGLSESIRVIGGVEHHSLCKIYNSAAAMVFPSLRESFGLPPLEALACGTPVIASNTSSLPEVLGDAALLVTPTDVRALMESMNAVVAAPDLAADLSIRGLEWSAQFSWQRTAQQTAEVYCHVAPS